MRNPLPRITLFLAIFGLLSFAPLMAQTPESKPEKSQDGKKQLEKQPAIIEIEFFEAIEKGYIEYSIIPKNSLNSRLTVVNKTDKRLDVAMPNAFAAIPASVVAQFDNYGGSGSNNRNSNNRGGNNNNNNGGGNQSYGGGGNSYGNSGGGYGNNSRSGRGGSNWSIAPEKAVQKDLLTVCLEHGKREPNRNVEYVMRPMSVFTDNLETAILCEKLGDGELEQGAVQAAVWHIENGLSWEALEKKARIQPGKRPVPYFHPQQIDNAKYMTDASQELAQKIIARQEAEAESKPVRTFDPSRSMTEQEGFDD